MNAAQLFAVTAIKGRFSVQRLGARIEIYSGGLSPALARAPPNFVRGLILMTMQASVVAVRELWKSTLALSLALVFWSLS